MSVIHAVDKALDVLIAVSDGMGEPVSLSSVASATGIPPSSCAHILTTLKSRGFVTQISRSAGYVPGPYAYYIVRNGLFQQELVAICDPLLKWLNRRLQCSAYLTMLIGGKKFVIDYKENESSHFLTDGNFYIGNLFSSATGRAMLAGMSRSELDALLETTGLPADEAWPDVKNRSDLDRELKTIKSAGVAICENTDGHTIIGQKILGTSKICAIGIEIEAAPSQQRLAEAVAGLRTAVKEIQRRLQF